MSPGVLLEAAIERLAHGVVVVMVMMMEMVVMTACAGPPATSSSTTTTTSTTSTGIDVGEAVAARRASAREAIRDSRERYILQLQSRHLRDD